MRVEGKDRIFIGDAKIVWLMKYETKRQENFVVGMKRRKDFRLIENLDGVVL